MPRTRSLLTLALAVLAACTASLLAADSKDDQVSSADVARHMRETLRTAKQYSYEQKDEYQKKLQTALDKMNHKIDVLNRKAEEGGEQVRAEARKKLAQLKPLRDKAQKELHRVKKATPGAWDDVKQGVSNALDDLTTAFEQASAHFKK
jgi:BMFP domain-containing protein YqiC